MIAAVIVLALVVVALLRERTRIIHDAESLVRESASVRKDLDDARSERDAARADRDKVAAELNVRLNHRNAQLIHRLMEQESEIKRAREIAKIDPESELAKLSAEVMDARVQRAIAVRAINRMRPEHDVAEQKFNEGKAALKQSQDVMNRAAAVQQTCQQRITTLSGYCFQLLSKERAMDTIQRQRARQGLMAFCAEDPEFAPEIEKMKEDSDAVRH